MKQSIKVVIVDDHLVMRDAIRNVIHKFHNMKVVATYPSGRQLLDSINMVHPDLILMDVCMPEMSGIETTKLLKEKHAHVGVLAISVFDYREYVCDMLTAGANGFISKNFEYIDLYNAITDIYEKGFHYNHIVTKQIVEELGIATSKTTVYEPIAKKPSHQEMQVLQYICDGLLTK